MAEPESQERLTLSRRRFLGLSGAAVALGWGGEAVETLREMWRQERAWSEAAVPNDDFLAEHAALFRRVDIGASFAPEQWPGDDKDGPEPMAALDWAVRHLGIRQMRLGLRWSRVEATRGVIDLSPYARFLEYAFQQGLVLCLNSGPIRTFRWPEDHLPGWAQADVPLPPDSSHFGSDAELAKVAGDYAGRLLRALEREYGAATLRGVAMIQTENEPFYPLRTHRWVMAGEYVRGTIEQAQHLFPDSKVLVATAGRLNFGPVQDLFARMLADSDRYRGRLVMGFDYHYKTPVRDSYPVIKYTDPLTFQRFGYQRADQNIELARRIGYGIEVTEAQAEPFGALEEPGNSARHFRFMLLRTAGRVLIPDTPCLIRIWGIEEMAKKVLHAQTTAEHQAIFDLVRRLNDAGRAPVRGTVER